MLSYEKIQSLIILLYLFNKKKDNNNNLFSMNLFVILLDLEWQKDCSFRFITDGQIRGTIQHRAYGRSIQHELREERILKVSQWREDSDEMSPVKIPPNQISSRSPGDRDSRWRYDLTRAQGPAVRFCSSDTRTLYPVLGVPQLYLSVPWRSSTTTII